LELTCVTYEPELVENHIKLFGRWLMRRLMCGTLRTRPARATVETAAYVYAEIFFLPLFGIDLQRVLATGLDNGRQQVTMPTRLSKEARRAIRE